MGRPIESIAKFEGSAYAEVSFADSFSYSSRQAELTHFSSWLEAFLSSDEFIKHSAQYEAINKRLESEVDRETRVYLIKQAHQLENHFKP